MLAVSSHAEPRCLSQRQLTRPSQRVVAGALDWIATPLRHSETEVELLGRVGPLKAQNHHADRPNTFGWENRRPDETDC
jgi:hypothetical protein